MPKRIAVAALLAVLTVAVLLEQARVRTFEALASAWIVGGLRVVPAESLQTAVVFPLRGRFVGYTLTPGCTAAFLVAPFLLLGAGLIIARRLSVWRGVKALAVVTVALFVANQARLVVIALSMRAWGFYAGYERSHVFLGTIVSTLGVIGGLLLFLRVASRPAPAEVDTRG